jgi:LPS sulfotransferase NodH
MMANMALQTQPVKRVDQPETNGTGRGTVPAFVIVGFPRSGFGLLQQMLDNHPLIAVTPDVHWIIDYFATRTSLNLEGRMASELVLKWVRQNRFAGFPIDPEQIRNLVPGGGLVSFRIFLSRLFDLCATARGKCLLGTTMLESLRSLSALHELWPNTKVVHLVRDGRDICLSFLGRDGPDRHAAVQFATWEIEKLSTIALWWRKKVRQGRKGGRLLGSEHYHEVHYEALVAQSVEECSKLCAFLGVPFETAMLRGHIKPTVERRDWRSQMPPGDLERWEAAAGDLLEELGYQRAFPRPGIEVQERVARINEVFAGPKEGGRISPGAIEKARRERAWTNPFVFIVGCPRSGTTLLQRLLNAHPESAISLESFWIPYFFKRRIGLTREGMVTRELVSQLFDYYKFYRMKLDRQDLEKVVGSEKPLTYSQFVTRIFDLYAENHGKPLAGDKTPDYVRNISVLHALWPQAKFVHLIRDGREVSLSAIAWKRKVDKLASLFSTWKEDPVTTAALWWEWHVRQGRDQGRILGPGLYYEMRYESLIAEPATECAKLCAFLGLPYKDGMLRFNDGRTRTETDLDAKNAWLPVTAGLRNWRTEMAAADLERFEAAVGYFLAELGYPHGISQPRPETKQHADRVRRLFLEDARCQEDLLP